MSKKQTSTSRSANEAEIVSLAAGLFDALPTLDFADKLLGKDLQLECRQDNSAVISIVHLGYSPKLRHVTKYQLVIVVRSIWQWSCKTDLCKDNTAACWPDSNPVCRVDWSTVIKCFTVTTLAQVVRTKKEFVIVVLLIAAFLVLQSLYNMKMTSKVPATVRLVLTTCKADLPNLKGFFRTNKRKLHLHFPTFFARCWFYLIRCIWWHISWKHLLIIMKQFKCKAVKRMVYYEGWLDIHAQFPIL